MAKAVIFEQLGGPDVLRVIERACPPPGPGEVRVAVAAIGLNRSDVAFRTGKYLVQPSFPSSLGVEGSGVVQAIGDGVTQVAPGDRVSILPGFPQGGRYATYVSEGLFPAASLVRIPDAMDYDAAAAIWVSYLTAWGALVELGDVRAGDPVLISAAASSVGLAALRIAKQIGAVAIATTRDAGKAQALKEAGADHVLITSGPTIPDEIRDITGAQGIRLAFDPIAGPFAESLFPHMGPEGSIFVYGGLSDQPMAFDRRPAIGKGLILRGYMVGQVLNHPDRFARAQAFIEKGLATSDVTPNIAKRFAFDQAAEAHRAMEANDSLGKIVLTA